MCSQDASHHWKYSEAGWGPEEPDLMKDVPAFSRGVRQLILKGCPKLFHDVVL